MPNSKTQNNSLITVVIAGLFALVAAQGGALFYVLTGERDQPAVQLQSETSPQISASDIAEIVRETMLDSERKKQERNLQAWLEPWKSARNVNERVYGNPDARFSIVVFSDLECPFCKRFNNTPKEVVDKLGNSVNFEFKHLPLDFHNPAALDGALMTECVGKWKGNQHAMAFIDQYFQKTQINGAGVSDLDGLVAAFGLSHEQILACKSDPEIAKRVQADIDFAAQAGINGTPQSFVVDTVAGQSIQVSGAQGPEVFMNAIRNMFEAEEAERLETEEQQ